MVEWLWGRECTGNFSRSPLNFSHSWRKFGTRHSLLGRFWGFIREKCLLFFYIPILGIGCEFFPCKLFPKLGTIWEHFPSYSLYRGIIGTCESQYRGIIGTCKSQYRGIIGTCKSQYTGVIETRKIHQRVIIGQIPLRGNFWDMENPLWGEIMWNSCPKIDFGRQFWYFFPNRLYSQIVNCKKFSVMGESPAITFCRNLGKYIFSFPGSFCIITMAGLLNLLLISCLRRFKNRKTLDNNDLNQVGVQRF